MKPKNPNMGYLAAFLRKFGGSQKSQDFFATMTDRKWREWQSRYHLIIEGHSEMLGSPMTWWETEFHQALQLGTYSPGQSSASDPRS